MDQADLRRCRSLLFLPASNPRAIEKARTLDADMVVLDVADAGWLVQKPVLAMIETPRAVIDAAAIASAARGLIAGTNDLSASLGLPPGSGRGGLVFALQRILLSARAAGTPAFDGVYNGLDDTAGLAAECAEGRAWGFDGKSLIHPSQIETANRAFTPSEAEIEAARRLVEASSGGG